MWIDYWDLDFFPSLFMYVSTIPLNIIIYQAVSFVAILYKDQV